MQQDIPGTTIFDGSQAQKGLALNRMCFSFNSAENRAAFLKDEDAYCRKYGLSDEQRAAVKSRSVLNMIEAGGNVYYLARRHFRPQRAGYRCAADRHERRGFQIQTSVSGGLIMATIVGGIGTTHVPSIGKAIAEGK